MELIFNLGEKFPEAKSLILFIDETKEMSQVFVTQVCSDTPDVWESMGIDFQIGPLYIQEAQKIAKEHNTSLTLFYSNSEKKILNEIVPEEEGESA